MQVTEISFSDALPIDGYGPGFFRVGGIVHHGAVLVTARELRGWDEGAEALTALAGTVDVILFGTGPEMTGAPLALTQAVEAAGMGLEPMASPAACRAYNMLLAEGRRVALAAVPI